MSKTWKPDKMRWISERQSWGGWLCLVLVLTTAPIGCNTTPATHSGDPLFGEYYPKGPNGQPLPPPNPGTQKTTSVGVPPYPTANSATSTAAIASNTGLSGERPLAINERNGTNGTLTSTTAPTPPGSAAPVVEPIPRDTSGPVAGSPPGASTSPAVPTNTGALPNSAGTIIPAGSWSTLPSASAPPAPATGTEPLQAALAAKGALGIKQENVPEGVRVSCYVPTQASPATLRYLETVAPDYATGLQALLQQVGQ